MDKLAGLLGGGDKNKQTQNQSNSAGQEDYLDKGLDALEKKFGRGQFDSNQMRGTNEKITDAVREQFEKTTGKHVPEKFSN